MVSPINARWNVFLCNDIPRVRSFLDFTILEDSFLNSAATVHGLVQPASLKAIVHTRGELGLREWVNSLVILWIILLSISGDMPLWLCPGILGSGPRAVALDIDVVCATADTEETILTPVGSP